MALLALSGPASADELRLHDGRVLGGGAAFIAGSHWEVVCRIQPDIQAQLLRYRRPLLMAAQHLLAVTRTRRLPVLAEPDLSIPGAVSFLKHLGFRRMAGNSYRLANADEYGYTPPATTLRPQTSRDLELGVRLRHAGGRVEARVYRSAMRDEIGFDPAATGPFGPGGANVNFDPTRRTGLEAESFATSTGTMPGIEPA
jgi:hypothetical protein